MLSPVWRPSLSRVLPHTLQSSIVGGERLGILGLIVVHTAEVVEDEDGGLGNPTLAAQAECHIQVPRGFRIVSRIHVSKARIIPGARFPILISELVKNARAFVRQSHCGFVATFCIRDLAESNQGFAEITAGSLCTKCRQY